MAAPQTQYDMETNHGRLPPPAGPDPLTRFAARIKQAGEHTPAVDVASIVTRAVGSNDLLFDIDVAFWKTIIDSSSAEDYDAYLLLFPDGVFASLARRRSSRTAAQAQAPAVTPAVHLHGLDYDQLSRCAKDNTERRAMQSRGHAPS